MLEFNIYLTFDIDQDFEPGSNDYYNRTKADFKSFGKGFLTLIDKLQGIPFSVFIRADHQIKSIYGSYNHLVTNNPELIRKIYQTDGELNWHIHIYEKKDKYWIQIKDDEKLIRAFLNDFKEVSKIREINSHIIRVGECVMNNALMKAINSVGIRIDSTALPGRKRNDVEKQFDWESTDNEFYNPSVKDYRISDGTCYKLKEIPMSTLLMQASYDRFPIRRYFNLSFKTNLLFQNFDEYVKNHNHLVAITHPFEVLSKGQHGLISYDINTFENNLRELKNRVLAYGKMPVYKRISNI